MVEIEAVEIEMIGQEDSLKRPERISGPLALRVVKIRSNAKLPEYASTGAAGMDLSACIEAPMVIPRGEVVLVPTGLVIALPPSHEGQVRPRSGLAAKYGVTVLNAPGTIDEDYRGEVCVLLINHSTKDYVIQPFERIAQLVIAPVTQHPIMQVDDVSLLGATSRGDGGFGSTGK